MFRKETDLIMEKVVFICGVLTIVFVVLIFGFLFKEGFLFFKEYGVFKFLTENYGIRRQIPQCTGFCL